MNEPALYTGEDGVLPAWERGCSLMAQKKKLKSTRPERTTREGDVGAGSHIPLPGLPGTFALITGP